MAAKTYYLKFNFVNGTERHFAIEAKNPPSNFMTNLDKLYAKNHIVLEMEEKIEVISLNNVLSIELTPPPLKDINGAVHVIENYEISDF